MVVINEQDANFIKDNIPNPERILEAATLKDALMNFLDWLDTNRDCWDSTGRDYSALGTKAQNVYDNIRISNGVVNST